MAKKGLPAIHPGEYLSETLGELNISQAEFARAFDQSPQYWLNLQAAYDLKTAEASLGKLLNNVHLLAHA
jgi:antitoxin HigA-1